MKGYVLPLLFVLLSLAGCKTEQSATRPARGVAEDFSLYMKRTACMGRCPVYELYIEATGVVRYQGYMNVELEGRFIKTLSAATMRKLIKAVEEAEYFAFQPLYDRHISDLPGLIMEVTQDGNTHKVEVRSGAPDALTALSKEVDELIGTEGFLAVQK